MFYFIKFFVNCIVWSTFLPVLARALNNNSARKPVCECGSGAVILTYICGRLSYKTKFCASVGVQSSSKVASCLNWYSFA